MLDRHVEVEAQLVIDRARDAARIELEPEEATDTAREHVVTVCRRGD